MDADCVEGDEDGVDEGAKEGVEDGADEHDAFYEEEEEGEDGDYDVEVCDAGGEMLVSGVVIAGFGRFGRYGGGRRGEGELQLTPY